MKESGSLDPPVSDPKSLNLDVMLSPTVCMLVCEGVVMYWLVYQFQVVTKKPIWLCSGVSHQMRVDYLPFGHKPQDLTFFWQNQMGSSALVVHTGISNRRPNFQVLSAFVPHMSHVDRGTQPPGSYANLGFCSRNNAPTSFAQIPANFSAGLVQIPIYYWLIKSDSPH
jgi:hypothetical protein